MNERIICDRTQAHTKDVFDVSFAKSILFLLLAFNRIINWCFIFLQFSEPFEFLISVFLYSAGMESFIIYSISGSFIQIMVDSSRKSFLKWWYLMWCAHKWSNIVSMNYLICMQIWSQWTRLKFVLSSFFFNCICLHQCTYTYKYTKIVVNNL